jgi:hypothetical protein
MGQMLFVPSRPRLGPGLSQAWPKHVGQMWNFLGRVPEPFCMQTLALGPNMFPNKNIYIYISILYIYVCICLQGVPSLCRFLLLEGLQGSIGATNSKPANMQTRRYNLKAISPILPFVGFPPAGGRCWCRMTIPWTPPVRCATVRVEPKTALWSRFAEQGVGARSVRRIGQVEAPKCVGFPQTAMTGISFGNGRNARTGISEWSHCADSASNAGA